MRNKVYSVRRLVLIVLALSGLLGPVTGLALPQPVSGSPSAPTEDLIPRAYLPIVMRPEEPDLLIYDMYGTLQDWDWLGGRFGDVTLDRGTGVAKVVELHEVEGDTSLTLWLQDASGQPVVGQEVVFTWPDAPDELEPHQQACGLTRGVVGYTKPTGEVGFGMGGGAYYDPDAGMVGPHTVWVVREGTDCLGGLGMLAFTNHIHLDSVWVLP
jgi:hypothetical protein